MPKLPEVEATLTMLDSNVTGVLDALDSLSADELNWTPPVAEGNSALVIATHVVGASQGHILQTLCGQAIDRDRDEEFRASGDSAAPLRESWAAVRGRLDAALERVDAARLDATHEHPILGPPDRPHDPRRGDPPLGRAPGARPALTRDLILARRS